MKTDQKPFTISPIVKLLFECFPGSFITNRGEFIAHKESNTYFNLFSCENDTEVKCKVLEQLSRAAFKTQYHHSDKKNRIFHEQMRSGISRFLSKEFSPEDMELIYTYLGGGIKRSLSLQFVESGFDMEVLRTYEA